MDRRGVVVHKHAKTDRGQYPAILTEHAWSIKNLLNGKRTLFPRGTPGNPERVIPSWQDSVILPSVHLSRSRTSFQS